MLSAFLVTRSAIVASAFFLVLYLAGSGTVFAGSGKEEKEDRILYFVSFSMPEASLKKAVEGAEKTGAILVLRGLKNDSFIETARGIQALIGEKKVEFQIDPPLFDEYEVTVVPCVSYRSYKVYGDVSLDCALEAIASKEPGAEKYVKAIRKGFYDQ